MMSPQLAEILVQDRQCALAAARGHRRHEARARVTIRARVSQALPHLLARHRPKRPARTPLVMPQA